MNPNQQQQKQQPPQQQLDRHTRFLLQSGDAEFATRARAHVRRVYGATAKVVTSLNTHALSEQSTVIVLYKDPAREVKDKQTGELRQRAMPTGYGKDKQGGERCEVLESRPVKCDAFYREGGDDNDGAVSLMAWQDAKGQARDGLVNALTYACAAEQGRAAPVRVQYDDRNHVLQVWGT